jgi:hypothetical protein
LNVALLESKGQNEAHSTVPHRWVRRFT